MRGGVRGEGSGGDQEVLTVMNSEGSLLVTEWSGVTSGWRALRSFTQSTLVSATVPRNTSCTHNHNSMSHQAGAQGGQTLTISGSVLVTSVFPSTLERVS